MALAKITLKCTTCGNEFEHRHQCSNRAAADSYTEWAKENISECPECRAKRFSAEREAAAVKAIEGMVLPEITKGSAKQIAWALKIRAEVIARLKDEQYNLNMLRQMACGEVPEDIKKAYPDKSVKEIIEMILARYPSAKQLMIMITSDDSRQIIDNR